MPARLSATERIRAQIDELFATDRDLGDILEDVARLGARLLLQTALEAQVTEFLGRERYARGDRVRPGYRNGHSELTVKTTAGPVTLERPKLRGTDTAFASRLLGKHVTRTNALEALVISGYVRGLSTRDVEAALAEALGPGRRCQGRPVAASARPARTSLTAGAAVAWPRSSWSTCTWTPATSRCTRAPAPSRCCAPGASPPTASRSCSPWTAPAPNPPTPALGSYANWSPEACGRRCWSSPTARPG